LDVKAGDLLHGDRHGVLTVPHQVATRVPAAAERLQRKEDRVIEFCKSQDFSVEGLGEVIKTLL
jgi:regulator of RNase E activity RraA